MRPSGLIQALCTRGITHKNINKKNESCTKCTVALANSDLPVEMQQKNFPNEISKRIEMFKNR